MQKKKKAQHGAKIGMTYAALARSTAAPRTFPSPLGVLGDKFDWFCVTKGEGVRNWAGICH